MSAESLKPDKTGENEFVLYDDPNRYARPAAVEIGDYSAVFHGYQEFTLTNHAIYVDDIDASLKRKYELLQPYFDPQKVSHRTLLDMGASGGFFCFWAVQNGAESATALDIDDKYLAMIEKAATRLKFPGVKAVRSNVMDWSQPADITVALALIHWIYSCTADYGSLDAAVAKIAQLTRYMSIIEWVDPDDQAIDFFHHLDWNAKRVSSTYNLEEFKKALDKHFVRYIYAGDVIPTRKLFVAYKTPNEINLAGPLPMMMPETTLISSRKLCSNNEVDYWSRVYDSGDCILKQAVLDLASREAYFLGCLDNEYFPRFIESGSENGWSFIKLEKIKGVPLPAAIDDIANTPAAFYNFILHCLQILFCMEKQGIMHRDIRMDNIIMRDGKPVLIDFGWAVSPEKLYFTPSSLGEKGRPSDGMFCDVFSMGKVLSYINNHRYVQFDKVIDLMTSEDAALRITDLEILRILFSIIAEGYSIES